MPVIKTFSRDKTIADLRNSVYAEVREFGNLNEASQGTAWKRATVLGLNKEEARTFVMDAMDAGLQDRKKELDIGAAAMRPKKLISAIDVEEVDEIRWLIPGWIPLNAISEISGPPGGAKSLVVLDFAAALSRGKTPITHKNRQPVNTAYLAPESEDIGGVLKSRFLAAGGDPERLTLYNSTDLDEDLGESFMADIAGELDERNIGFLVFDTISAWKMGDQKGPTYFREIMRAVMRRLNPNRACLLIHHFTKGLGGGSERTSGNWAGNVGGVRSLMTVGKPEEDEVFFALAHAKSNYSQPSLSQKFETIERTNKKGGRWPCVQWLGPIASTSDDMASVPTLRKSGQILKTVEWLKDLLNDGPVRSIDVMAAAHQDETVSWNSVKVHAKTLANVESCQIDGVRHWRLR